MVEKEVRKTTTKRAVRRTPSKTVPARTTVRKTVPTTVRKAPARVQPVSVKQERSFKVFVVGFFLFATLLGVSALIGLSDKGQLNVESAIAIKKAKATPEELESLKSVPTEQTKDNVPNGGLVGAGSDVPVPPIVTATTSVASSTASSSVIKTDTAPPTESTDTLPPSDAVTP